MATRTDKKNTIRQDIIDSANVYSKELAGKVFLYVYGDEFFEVSFPVALGICALVKKIKN